MSSEETSSSKHPEIYVTDLLRYQIQSGEYKAGEWLPAERRLAESLKVDRRVVRLAINRLVKTGLVTREPHCRPVVASFKPVVASFKTEAAPSAPVLSAASSIVALLMWRGSTQLERTLTSQQRLFWGMNQALAEAGHHAVFLDLGEVGSEEENAVREAELLGYVLKQGFGGAAFYPYAYSKNEELIEEVRRTIPFTTIDRRCAVETDFVGVENYQAMYDTVVHLVTLGHRRIAYVTKNEQIVAVQERTQGYLDAMRDADLDDMVLLIPVHSHEKRWKVAEAVFRLPPAERPTAAAVFNDHSAVHLARRLEALGLSVPEDVAITGFDDIIPALPNGVGLTTTAQPYEEIGRKAVALILRRRNNLSAPVISATLPTTLIVRESSQYRDQDRLEP